MKQEPPVPRWLLAVLAVTILALLAGGFWLDRAHQGDFRRIDDKQPPGIVQAQGDRIAVWRTEPMPDARVLTMDAPAAVARSDTFSDLMLALIAGLVVASAAITGLIWQRSGKAHFLELLQVETARRESEECYRITLMSVGDGVITTDPRGRVELINGMAEELTGWDQEAARGKPLDEVFRIIDEETRQPIESPVRRVLRGDYVASLGNHTLLVTRHGLERPISDSCASIRDTDGNPSGMVLVFRDQTRGRKAHLALQRKSEVDAALTDLSAKLLQPDISIIQVANCVLHHALALTGSEQALVASIDPKTGNQIALTVTELKAESSVVTGRDAGIIFPIGPDGRYPGLWGHALNTREPFFTEQPSCHPAAGEAPEGHIPLFNFLAVPAIAGGRLLGQIALANARDGYSADKLRVVQRLAELYGMFLRQWLIREELRESETRFRHISSSMSDLAYSSSRAYEGSFAIDWLTGAAERITGYSIEAIKDLGCWRQLVHEDDLELYDRRVIGLTPGSSGSCELRLRHRNGGTVWVASFAECVQDARDPERLRIYGALVDITQRHEVEEKVRLNAAVIDSTRDGVVITDLTPTIVAVNRAYVEITGYSETEVLGKNPRLLQSGRHDLAFYQTLWAALQQTGHWQGEIWNRRKNGEVYPEWLTISTVRDSEGKATHYVAVFTDISQLKQSESRLERLAHYDPLTNLPNRLLVKSRLEHALERAKRRNSRVAVLFIDLDRFKTVNDSLGHPAGDALLAAVATRLAERLRKEDTLGRLGGDEFLVILEQLRSPEDATVVARALLAALEGSFTLPNDQEVYIRASIGISLYPNDGTSSAELIRNADAAMYQVKDGGRNAYGYYTEALTHAAAERLRMETRLRRALERDEFVLHYQPMVSVAGGRLLGAEALVRWQPPGEDMVLPAHFIRIAEETGLIVPLGEWVLRQTCGQAKAWLDAGQSFGHMALNLSVRQFQQRDLERFVCSVLRETGLPPACLELEITESCLMEQGERAEENLRAIKSLGVRLSIDDFGTGYSSLAYLKRLPLDRLKIDHSFIRDIPDDPNDVAIASTIIAMAHHLGLRAIAEGVETEAQLAFLLRQGCDAYQGFLYSPPLPADEFALRYLRASSPENGADHCEDRG